MAAEADDADPCEGEDSGIGKCCVGQIYRYCHHHTQGRHPYRSRAMVKLKLCVVAPSRAQSRSHHLTRVNQVHRHPRVVGRQAMIVNEMFPFDATVRPPQTDQRDSDHQRRDKQTGYIHQSQVPGEAYCHKQRQYEVEHADEHVPNSSAHRSHRRSS